jgi:trehalose transport system substrate-binding protein
MRLDESEWRVMRAEVFPRFEAQCRCAIISSDVPPEQLGQLLQAMVRAGQVTIDVFAQDNMRLLELVRAGVVQDLTAYQDRIPGTVPRALIEAGRFGGRLYFFPYRPNVQIVYYNAPRFERHGLSPPKTWLDLLHVARTFREKEGIGRVLFTAWGGAPTATLLYEWITSADGDPLVLTDPKTVETFRFLQRLWPYLSPDSRQAKWDTTNQFLAQESAYLAQNWPFGVRLLVQEYGKTAIQTYSGWAGPARKAHVIGGEVLGIPSGSRDPGLALDFIRFMQSRSVQEILTMRLGWPAVRTDAYDQVEAWMRPHFDAITEALEHGIFRRNLPYWPDYEKLLNEAFVRIVVRGEAVEGTLHVLQARLERVQGRY